MLPGADELLGPSIKLDNGDRAGGGGLHGRGSLKPVSIGWLVVGLECCCN